MELIIEEISRNHKLLNRHKFLTNKVNVGRSYHNDIILTDPHICPEHLSFEQQGEQWIVKDNQSVNGSYLSDSKLPADGHIIHSGDVITIGKSQIRCLFPNHPTAATVSFSPFESIIDLMRHPMVLISSIFLFALMTGFMFYLNQPHEVNFSQYIVRAIGATLVFALWPIIVALISHFNKHEARILTQLGICFVFFNLMWLSDVLEAIVEFNSSANLPLFYVVALMSVALAFCLFWLNCYIGFHMSNRRRVIIAGSLTAIIFGGGFMVQLSKQPEHSLRPLYNAKIMNPVFKLAPTSSVEYFINDSRKMFKAAQKAAQKEQKD